LLPQVLGSNNPQDYYLRLVAALKFDRILPVFENFQNLCVAPKCFDHLFLEAFLGAVAQKPVQVLVRPVEHNCPH
jgi:hypothetical protein